MQWTHEQSPIIQSKASKILVRAFAGPGAKVAFVDRAQGQGVRLAAGLSARGHTGEVGHPDVFAGNTQRRHYFLYLGQNRIIATTRTPSNFLVGGKVFGGKFWRDGHGICTHRCYYIVVNSERLQVRKHDPFTVNSKRS